MQKAVISVLGADRPGIIARVSRLLADAGANIEDISQTIVQTWFSGTFIATAPRELVPDALSRTLTEALSPQGLHVAVFAFSEPAAEPAPAPEPEPFVVTTMGADRKGLVAGITEVMAAYGANVTHLRAVFRGGTEPGDNVMIYELDVPADADRAALKKALTARAGELGLSLSMQHRKIFETLSRI